LSELLFTFGLGMEACHSGILYELSPSPREGKSHFHPVIARLTESAEAISWWSMRLPRPDMSGRRMTRSEGTENESVGAGKDPAADL